MKIERTLFTGLALSLILGLACCGGSGSIKKTDFEGDWRTGWGSEITIKDVTEKSFSFSFTGVTESGNIGELEGEALITADNKAVFAFKNEELEISATFEFSITDGKLIVALTEGYMAGYFGRGVYMQGEYTKHQSEVAQQHEEMATADESFLTKMLRNNAKIVRLDPEKSIVVNNGKVYNSAYLEIPGSKRVSSSTGFAVTTDAIIYTEEPAYFEHPYELWCMDLQGNAKKLIVKNTTIFGICIAGDRVIYTTRNALDLDWETTGLYWYDLNTSKNTRLLEKKNQYESYSVISFDDDFLYYTIDSASEVWRVRWNGTQEEVMLNVEIPEGFYKVENDYYYCIKRDYENFTAEISRYAIDNSKQAVIYSVSVDMKEIVDGWAYFVNEKGFHKINMANGSTILLADFTPFNNITFNMLLGITGDGIYFNVMVEEEDVCTERWYKVPPDGGTMELLAEGECHYG